MMKKKIILFIAALLASCFVLPLYADVSSLRGDHSIDASAKKPQKHKQMVVEGGFKRDFEKQPPLIPHNIEKYEISLRNNGCLTCHGNAAYEKEHSTKVSDSHFLDRDGKRLKNISMRRYFCTQCHVTQVQTKELITNKFGE